jgi:hypothetical protein
MLAVLATLQTLSGQSKGLIFSVVAGVNKSTIVGDSDSWKDPFGAMGGVILNFARMADDMVSFRAEVNFSMQGANWEEDWGQGLVSGTTRLNYINIPIVVRYQLEGGFFGEIGIQPGFLVSAKDKYEGMTDDWMEYMNKIDFGIPVEVGYEFKNNIGVGVRVVPGISNIYSDDEAKDRNLVGSLRVTYTFNK